MIRQPGQVPVILPDLGPATERIRICAWYVQPGDVVAIDDPLLAVAIPGATCDISAPCAGRVCGPLARTDSPATPGSICAWIDPGG